MRRSVLVPVAFVALAAPGMASAQAGTPQKTTSAATDRTLAPSVRAAYDACVVRGQWDGGDDSDPKSQPGDWYRVTVICARGIPATRFE